jgi:hypothetical protein
MRKIVKRFISVLRAESDQSNLGGHEGREKEMSDSITRHEGVQEDTAEEGTVNHQPSVVPEAAADGTPGHGSVSEAPREDGAQVVRVEERVETFVQVRVQVEAGGADATSGESNVEFSSNQRPQGQSQRPARHAARGGETQEGSQHHDAPTLDVEREDDEETWTNQPAAGGSAPFYDDEDDLRDAQDDDDEGEEYEEEDEQAEAPRKAITNARDVVCDDLPYRAARAKLRLRPYLSSTLVIHLTGSGERFLFDWRAEDLKVTPCDATVSLAQGEPADSTKVDAIISVSDQHLMQIRAGDLNPQLAMVADKIRVQGKVAPAVYLFNLIAPRERA